MYDSEGGGLKPHVVKAKISRISKKEWKEV
jgi:hypothetical protein